MDDHMTGPYGAPGGAPTYVPYRIWRFDLIWGALTLLAVLAAVAALATAETSGGRLVGGLIFGTASVACVAGWVNLHRHPSWLEVSGQAITRGTLGRPTTTTLSR
ncbi:MAG TPA: hypothetical protein VF743_04550, partial [Acidimicrobiales bacterium]